MQSKANTTDSVHRTEDNPDGQPSAQARNRRGFIAWGILGALSAAAAKVVIQDHILDTQWRENTRQRYGEFDNPRFQVRNDPAIFRTPTHRSILTARELNGDLSKDEAQMLESAILRARTIIAQIERAAPAKSDIADDFDRLGKAMAQVEVLFGETKESLAERISTSQEARREALETALRATESTHADLRPTFGTPESYVKDLIVSLTGVRVPEVVRFEVREIAERHVGGYSRAKEQLIVSRDGHFARVVLTYAHEFGHLMNLHHEEFALGSKPLYRDEVDAICWEEACAYAFEATASEAIADPQLQIARMLFKGEKTSILDQFYRGEEATECHRVGLALFDAALTTCGSAGGAYNYLSTNRALTPEMQQVIQDNLSHAQRLEHQPASRLARVEQLAQELYKDLQNLGRDR
jgi:hypothetical protein